MTGKFMKILCPVDLDGSASSALEMAAVVARQSSGQVHVLHVVSMPLPAEGAPVFVEVSKEQAELARASVAQLVAKHLADVASETQVEIGDPGYAIVALAKRLPADLVVMATHGRKGVSRFFLGSVAETVMRGVTCPVLTAKYFAVDRHSVARWMTTHVHTIAPDEKLTTACARLQQHHMRSLPVVENGKLIGIITDRDIRTHLSYLDTVDARHAMTEAVITVTPQTTIWDAGRLLRERRIGAIPVLEGERLVGIISTSDLLEALIELQ